MRLSKIQSEPSYQSEPSNQSEPSKSDSARSLDASMYVIRLSSLGLFVGLLALSFSAFAAERTFEFTGVVEVGSPSYYGETIAASAPLTGGFAYDSNSVATHSPVCSGNACAGYEQQHINGFWLEIDGVEIVADNYIIEVSNDVVSQFVTTDVISVRFASDLTPPLSAPLLVEGNPQTTGVFSISFFASPSLLTDASLPNDLDPADFSLEPFANLLGDTFNQVSMTFDIDVLFTMSTFSSISFDTSDHDLDGDVDGADFLIWQRNQGGPGQNGDADSNLLVDGSDLSAWRSQFGNTLLAQTMMSVPEPGSLAVLCVFLVLTPRSFVKLKSNPQPEATSGAS